LNDLDFKNKFHFKEENDAFFGFILGVITGTFNQWLLDNSREMSEDTLIEIQKIIFHRSAQIRDKIMEAG
jgi:hypothetical protein